MIVKPLGVRVLDAWLQVVLNMWWNLVHTWHAA